MYLEGVSIPSKFFSHIARRNCTPQNPDHMCMIRPENGDKEISKTWLEGSGSFLLFVFVYTNQLCHFCLFKGMYYKWAPINKGLSTHVFPHMIYIPPNPRLVIQFSIRLRYRYIVVPYVTKIAALTLADEYIHKQYTPFTNGLVNNLHSISGFAAWFSFKLY